MSFPSLRSTAVNYCHGNHISPTLGCTFCLKFNVPYSCLTYSLTDFSLLYCVIDCHHHLGHLSTTEDVSRPRDEMDDFELQLEAFKRYVESVYVSVGNFCVKNDF